MNFSSLVDLFYHLVLAQFECNEIFTQFNIHNLYNSVILSTAVSITLVYDILITANFM